MPVGTCDPASRGMAYNETTIENRLPDGSGVILVTVRYGWDGVSTLGDCDGPVSYLRTRNTGASSAWAMLPNRKRDPKWLEIPPGTDSIITAAGQLNTLGLSDYSDVAGVGLVYSQPA